MGPPEVGSTCMYAFVRASATPGTNPPVFPFCEVPPFPSTPLAGRAWSRERPALSTVTGRTAASSTLASSLPPARPGEPGSSSASSSASSSLAGSTPFTCTSSSSPSGDSPSPECRLQGHVSSLMAVHAPRATRKSTSPSPLTTAPKAVAVPESAKELATSPDSNVFMSSASTASSSPKSVCFESSCTWKILMAPDSRCITATDSPRSSELSGTSS
mmetsp:Transcript_27109/g.75759  ORF Transcript_27109/g.75759 Transcript_27109/m.75759 type:complete len:216 (+) Transcript_27109:1886-2533(+)